MKFAPSQGTLFGRVDRSRVAPFAVELRPVGAWEAGGSRAPQRPAPPSQPTNHLPSRLLKGDNSTAKGKALGTNNHRESTQPCRSETPRSPALSGLGILVPRSIQGCTLRCRVSPRWSWGGSEMADRLTDGSLANTNHPPSRLLKGDYSTAKGKALETNSKNSPSHERARQSSPSGTYFEPWENVSY